MIDKQFLIERQGKTFSLYAGLLDAAHHDGLKRITTTLLQVGNDQNNQTWIVAAEVETSRGTFSGIGDASPANVNRAMLHCLPRLAETRAKARALRDAVNAGALVSVEELGDDTDTHSVDSRPTVQDPVPLRQPSATTPATEQQKAAILRLAPGTVVDGLNRVQAAEMIRNLQKSEARA